MTYAVATRTITQSSTDADLTGLKTLIDSGVVAAARNTAYTLGNVRKNDSAGTAWWYQVTTAGTSAVGAPTWNTTDGGTTVDGGVTWTTRKAPTYVVTGTTGNIRTEYKLESFNFSITGTQTHNPETEQITFCEVPTSTQPIPLGTNATYNLGVAYTSGGVTQYSTGLGIVNSKALGSTHGFNSTYINSAVVYANASGCTFNWRGGIISSPVGFRSNNSGNVNVESGMLHCPYNSTAAYPPVITFNANSGTVSLVNLTIQGNTAKNGLLIQVEKAITLNNVTLYFGSGFGTGGSTIESPTGTSTAIPVKNFAPIGAGLVGLPQTEMHYTFWRQNYLKAINALAGTASPCWGMDVSSNNAVNLGLVNFFKEVTPLMKNTAGTAVQDALVFLRDTNNSDRPSDYRGQTWSADRTYNWTTDANGVASMQEVLLGCKVKRVSGTPWDNIESSYRCPGGAAGNDVFTFSVWAYGYQYAAVPVSLRGNGAAVVTGTLVADATIVQTNRATVAAYATLETLDKARDYSAYFKTVLANVETPSISTEVLTPEGSVLNYGTYNLVVDNAAGSVMAFATGTVTIKAATLATGSRYLSVKTSGYVNAPACSEGMTFDGCSYVQLTAIPTAATIKNSTQGFRITTAGTYDLSAWTMTGNTKDITVTATVGTVTILTGGNTGWTVNNTGGATLVRDDAVKVSIALTGLVAGSRVLLHNVTDDVELYNAVVAGTSVSVPFDWFSNKTIFRRVTNVSGTTAYAIDESTGVVTNAGLSFIVAQAHEPIYEGNLVDGSTVTGLTLDVPNIQIDADEVDNALTVQEIYAWYMDELMTADGIRTLAGAITAINAHKYRVNTAQVPLKIDQKDAVNSLVISGGMIYRDDGASIRLAGSGVIEFILDDVYESAAAEQQLAAIKAKTDNLPAKPAAKGDVIAMNFATG